MADNVETAEDRHGRILARDLAWLSYSAGHERDGVPCSPRNRLHFFGGWECAYAEFQPRRAVEALAFVDKAIDNVTGFPADMLWRSDEVVRMLDDVRSLLVTGKVTP